MRALVAPLLWAAMACPLRGAELSSPDGDIALELPEGWELTQGVGRDVALAAQKGTARLQLTLLGPPADGEKIAALLAEDKAAFEEDGESVGRPSVNLDVPTMLSFVEYGSKQAPKLSGYFNSERHSYGVYAQRLDSADQAALIRSILQSPYAKVRGWAVTSDALMQYPAPEDFRPAAGNQLELGGKTIAFYLALEAEDGRFVVVEKISETPAVAETMEIQAPALLELARERSRTGGQDCGSAGTRSVVLLKRLQTVQDDFRCRGEDGSETPKPIIVFRSGLGLFAAVASGVSLERLAWMLSLGRFVAADWKAGVIRSASPPGRILSSDLRLDLPLPEGFTLFADGLKEPRAVLTLSDPGRRFLAVEKTKDDPEFDSAKSLSGLGPEMLLGTAEAFARQVGPEKDCRASPVTDSPLLPGWTSFQVEIRCPGLAASGFGVSSLVFLWKGGTIYKATGFGLPLATVAGLFAQARELGDAARPAGQAPWSALELAAATILPAGAAFALLAFWARRRRRRAA